MRANAAAEVLPSMAVLSISLTLSIWVLQFRTVWDCQHLGQGATMARKQQRCPVHSAVLYGQSKVGKHAALPMPDSAAHGNARAGAALAAQAWPRRRWCEARGTPAAAGDQRVGGRGRGCGCARAAWAQGRESGYRRGRCSRKVVERAHSLMIGCKKGVSACNAAHLPAHPPCLDLMTGLQCTALLGALRGGRTSTSFKLQLFSCCHALHVSRCSVCVCVPATASCLPACCNSDASGLYDKLTIASLCVAS